MTDITDDQIKRWGKAAGFRGPVLDALRHFAELARQDEQRRQVVRHALDEKTRLDAKRWEALMSFGFTGEEWTELHECLRLRASARLQAFIDRARGSDKPRSDGLTLASPEMAAAMAELKRRIKEQPGFGRQLLRDAGIINDQGELTERFCGTTTDTTGSKA